MKVEQLNFHHLFYFWRVARTGHLTRATRREAGRHAGARETSDEGPGRPQPAVGIGRGWLDRRPCPGSAARQRWHRQRRRHGQALELHALAGVRVVGTVVVAAGRVVHHQRGVEVVAQRPVWVEVLVVTMVNRMGHLVRQPLGLPGALSRQHPRHGLQQQAEQQEPGGKGGFHSG
mgnify:CR=1 FL=1